MARTPRIHSFSNVYHVMLRGINRQQIFEERSDYIQFIKILYELIPICDYKLYAYCLMGNHVHLLIKVNGEPIDMIMKRLEIRFVQWYNKKYERTGHLFENRYKSEPVDDERYLLTVFRYILQNPIKAGISNTIFEYPWSSASSLLSPSDSLISISDFKNYFHSPIDCINYLKEPNNDICLEDNIPNKEKCDQLVSDDQILSYLKEKTDCSSIAELQRLDIKIRNKFIQEASTKISVRQLARLTGLSKSQIQRINRK